MMIGSVTDEGLKILDIVEVGCERQVCQGCRCIEGRRVRPVETLRKADAKALRSCSEHVD